MDLNNSKVNLQIKIAEDETLVDLSLCAKEFIEFIDEFHIKFLEKKYFILTAYFNQILAGILIAEDKTQKIDSLEKMLPKMQLHLIFVNKQFRKKNIGKILLESLLLVQKKKGIATIYVQIPQQYKDGIRFFLRNNFYIILKKENYIKMELNLWKDFGIRDCQIIGENFNDLFS